MHSETKQLGQYVPYTDAEQIAIFGKVTREVAYSFPVSVNLAMSKEQAQRLGRETVTGIMPDLPNSKDIYFKLWDLPEDKVIISGDSWKRIVDIPRNNIVEIMNILYPDGLDERYWKIISAIEGDTIRLLGFGD